MTSVRLLSILVLLLAALGLEAQVITTAPKVKAEYDREEDFSRYQAYDWISSQKPADNAANHIRLTRAIKKEMDDLGFRIDTAKPDVRILYRVYTSSKVFATSSQTPSAFDSSNLRTDFVFSKGSKKQYGTLIIELFNADTNVRIWRGTTSQELRTPDNAEKIINEAVKRVFTAYPARKNSER